MDLITSLVGAEAPAVAAQPTGSTKGFQTLLVSTEDNITTIRFNRPEKKNAITVEVKKVALDKTAFLIYF